MATDVLKNIAAQFADVEEQIKEAEDLLKAMQDAGEDVTTMKADLGALKMRRDKWVRMLSARGLTGKK